MPTKKKKNNQPTNQTNKQTNKQNIPNQPTNKPNQTQGEKQSKQIKPINKQTKPNAREKENNPNKPEETNKPNEMPPKTYQATNQTKQPNKTWRKKLEPKLQSLKKKKSSQTKRNSKRKPWRLTPKRRKRMSKLQDFAVGRTGSNSFGGASPALGRLLASKDKRPWSHWRASGETPWGLRGRSWGRGAEWGFSEEERWVGCVCFFRSFLIFLLWLFLFFGVFFPFCWVCSFSNGLFADCFRLDFWSSDGLNGVTVSPCSGVGSARARMLLLLTGAAPSSVYLSVFWLPFASEACFRHRIETLLETKIRKRRKRNESPFPPRLFPNVPFFPLLDLSLAPPATARACPSSCP